MSDTPTQEQHELTQDERLANLEASLAEVLQQNEALKQQVSDMSMAMVNNIAAQIQMLFNNPIMLSSIASAILATQQNALSFRANHSRERAPQAMIIDNYVRGAQRIMLTETGDVIMEQQLADATGPDVGWELDESITTVEGGVESLRELLQVNNVEGGKYYYLIDDISLQAHREDVARLVAERDQQMQREDAVRA